VCFSVLDTNVTNFDAIRINIFFKITDDRRKIFPIVISDTISEFSSVSAAVKTFCPNLGTKSILRKDTGHEMLILTDDICRFFPNYIILDILGKNESIDYNAVFRHIC